MKDNFFKTYALLIIGTGTGSTLSAGIIIGLSSTITIWQNGLGLSDYQVGILSGCLTLSIAAGAFCAGIIEKKGGLISAFQKLKLLYAIGTLFCAISWDFYLLLFGLVLAGFSSGADLPVSISVAAGDAKDESSRARLVSFTQIFWQIGIFLSYLCTFIGAKMQGIAGARIVFGILFILSLTSFLMRNLSDKLKKMHKEAGRTGSRAEVHLYNTIKKVPVFWWILLYYIFWNLISNTWGQFQTFMFVKADASQSLAVESGIIINIFGLLAVMLVTRTIYGKHRKTIFILGIVIQFFAMINIMLAGSRLWMVMFGSLLYNVGHQFAGEAIYKVWTQEAFSDGERASVQGFINGAARLSGGIFAFVTPLLIQSKIIPYTMLGFALIVMFIGCVGMRIINGRNHKYK